MTARLVLRRSRLKMSSCRGNYGDASRCSTSSRQHSQLLRLQGRPALTVPQVLISRTVILSIEYPMTIKETA
jgi:hypothetical protein